MSVVAIPFVVGFTALPSVLSIVPPTLAVILTAPLSAPAATTDVEIRLLSPFTVNVPSFNNTSLLPVSAAYFKLTFFNWATLTASVSAVPAARPVNWRVFVTPSPMETAARVDVPTAPA